MFRPVYPNTMTPGMADKTLKLEKDKAGMQVMPRIGTPDDDTSMGVQSLSGHPGLMSTSEK